MYWLKRTAGFHEVATWTNPDFPDRCLTLWQHEDDQDWHKLSFHNLIDNEDIWSVDLTSAEIDKFKNIEQLLTYVKSKGKARAIPTEGWK